jgi:hypothetical protein
MMDQSGKTYIGTLRAVTSERDRLACRIRLTNALAAMEIYPQGLPSTAIICIRKLNAALPRSSFSAHHSRRPPPHKLERAVASSLSKLLDQAAYPARGVVPPDALAVIFEDQSELIACFAADWCEKEATAARWWWRGLFGRREFAATLLPLWLERAEYIPAALAHLSSRGKLLPFARQLSASDARRLLRSVTEKHALFELQAKLEELAQNENHAATEQPPSLSTRDVDERPSHPRTSSLSSRRGPPWSGFITQAETDEIGLEQQCLIGVGLMLMLAPARARTDSFAREFYEWRRSILTGEGESPSISPAAGEDASAWANAHRSVEPPGDALERSSSGAASLSKESARDTADVQSNPQASGEPAKSDDASLTKQGRAFVSRGPSETARLNNDGSPFHVDAMRDAAGHDERFAVEDVNDGLSSASGRNLFETRIETGLGGIFYLINLGLFLNLYGDFTAPARPGIALSIWDFLVLLGARLPGERMPGDAVWSLLSSLAGRGEDDEPGFDFAAPDVWRMDARWLAPFVGPGDWTWRDDEGRLRVRHPAGFLVLDVPRETASADEQLEDEMHAYRSMPEFILRRGEEGQEVEEVDDEAAANFKAANTEAVFREKRTGRLERWLGWLLSYTEARLRLALGLLQTEDISRVLLEHRARVQLTRTHLSVFFELSELPIEVRLAGLDRDPGWVPAAGRYVAFHYL